MKKNDVSRIKFELILQHAFPIIIENWIIQK